MPVPTLISQLSSTASSNSPLGTESVGTIMNQYIQAAYAFIAQINTNVTNNFTPLGTLTAPSGTRLVMQQAAAPAGWTVDISATFTDCAMRFSQGAGNGGIANWSSWNFGNVYTVSSTAITTAQMPAHNHGVSDPGHTHSNDSIIQTPHNHGLNDPGHSHVISPGAFNFNSSSGTTNTFVLSGSTNTQAATTGISMQAQYANVTFNPTNQYTGVSTQNAGSGAGHNHTLTTPQVKYADCIVAIKS